MVCSGSFGTGRPAGAEVEAATRGWTGRPVGIVSLNPMSLDDVWRDMAKVAATVDALFILLQKSFRR